MSKTTLYLKSGHINFDVALVKELFKEEEQVNWVYYPDRQQLLVAAMSKVFFSKLHKTSWNTLKIKSSRGDKALFVRDIIIENDLDEADRELNYIVKKSGIIEIEFK